MQTTLTSLAPELIEEISARIAENYTSTLKEVKADLGNFRLVCQQTRAPPELFLFRDITLDGRKKRALSFLSTEEEVEKLISANAFVFRGARVLRLKFGSGALQHIKTAQMSNMFLTPILTAFRSVRSVEWVVESSDPCPTILNALATLEHLTTLMLSFNRSVPFHEFSLLKLEHLRRLSITNTWEQRFTQDLLEQVSTLMNDKGLLTHVSIDTGLDINSLPEAAPRSIRFTFPKPKVIPVPEEVPQAGQDADGLGAPPSTEGEAEDSTPKPQPPPPTTTSCPLQYLRLRGCGFIFKSRPQLSTLETLDIHHLTWPTNKSIWASLTHVGDVRLKTVVVDSVSPLLFAYLKSYSGVEKLVWANMESLLDDDGDPNTAQTSEGSIRSTVYEKIIPLHHASLRSLSLANMAPLDWSLHRGRYEPHTATLLSCSRLSSLSIDLLCQDVGQLPTTLHAALTALLTLPSLEFLAINLRASGDPSLWHWGAENTIKDYPIPRGNVFKVSTGKSLFTPKWMGGEKRRWRLTPFKAVGDTALQLGWVL